MKRKEQRQMLQLHGGRAHCTIIIIRLELMVVMGQFSFLFLRLNESPDMIMMFGVVVVGFSSDTNLRFL